ncbi:sulfite exporter TauE/SafE family protein [Celeribacter sp. SCSIO 80788]|uniref:sulfite exporter TauE/SafE family protein n=1 Tax=Celeribacter sp. SCSIO 80788 TaxID=3117013 RepID=UPI003DA340AA
MPGLSSDPYLLAVSVLAVVLVGLSKGGLGGMSLLGVPLMSLYMPPMTAAAVLLPILIVMDMVSLSVWRRHVDWRILKIVLPAAVLGIGIGWGTAEVVTDAEVRLIVGVVSLAFVARVLWQKWGRPAAPVTGTLRPMLGRLCGMVGGFTSFVAHAGAPPLQIYLLPLGLDPKTFTGTCVLFFAVTNAIKLIPYIALGQFDGAHLMLSAVLMPMGLAATYLGAWIVRKMRPAIFYPLTYASIALVGLKLVQDGIAGMG